MTNKKGKKKNSNRGRRNYSGKSGGSRRGKPVPKTTGKDLVRGLQHVLEKEGIVKNINTFSDLVIHDHTTHRIITDPAKSAKHFNASGKPIKLEVYVPKRSLAGCNEARLMLRTMSESLTADMIVEWLRVGFVHGVMNTDNMSVLGLTIDYGPYGWLDDYNPNWTPNTTDAQHRRYRYGNQPAIAQWNLVQLANALYPLVGAVEPLQEALENYAQHFEAKWSQMMATKLGLTNLKDQRDRELAEQALAVLQTVETDMTLFWRELANVDFDSSVDEKERCAPLMNAVYRSDLMTSDQRASFVDFAEKWSARHRELGNNAIEVTAAMNAVNPKYVLRNYMAQLAIEKAEEGDPSMVTELLDVLRLPYEEQPQYERFYALRPDWARTKIGCSQLSCSS